MERIAFGGAFVSVAAVMVAAPQPWARSTNLWAGRLAARPVPVASILSALRTPVSGQAVKSPETWTPRSTAGSWVSACVVAVLSAETRARAPAIEMNEVISATPPSTSAGRRPESPKAARRSERCVIMPPPPS